MRRRGPAEAEACGVWLDAAALKRRKVQTRLSNPITRMLPPTPQGERETIVGFSQRRVQPVGTRQTVIESFFSSKSGKASDCGRERTSPGTASQRKKEQKRDVMWMDPPPLTPGNECAQHPETTAASVTKELQLICPPPSLREVSDSYTEARPAVLSSQDQKLSVPQLNIVDSAKVDFAIEQNSESLSVLAYGGKGGDICCRSGHETKCLVDRAEMESKVFSKENKQFSVLPQGHQKGKAGKGENRESWRGGDIEIMGQRSCSKAFSLDSERYDPDLKSQLFTEDSQGQMVIAHPSRAPFQDVANLLRKSQDGSLSSQIHYQGWPVVDSFQLNSQPDLLFTQDSQGNRVIKH